MSTSHLLVADTPVDVRRLEEAVTTLVVAHGFTVVGRRTSRVGSYETAVVEYDPALLAEVTFVPDRAMPDPCLVDDELDPHFPDGAGDVFAEVTFESVGVTGTTRAEKLLNALMIEPSREWLALRELRRREHDLLLDGIARWVVAQTFASVWVSGYDAWRSNGRPASRVWRSWKATGEAMR